ncbi:hypothetical protein [Chitinophaga sp. CB10]|uniref:hypothetical protein n=1 Tax=Chitinophaga sp. CB10 TaxID=1891659 RepID=UPI0025BC3E82|nr:hypothetical protein [Chitinophaga sp. CB10]
MQNDPHFNTIEIFIDLYESPEKVQVLMWELLSAGMCSEYADDWDKNKRADMLMLYEQVCSFSYAIFDLSTPMLELMKNFKPTK